MSVVTSTNLTPLPASDAVPATLTVAPVDGPDIVAPLVGELIDTVGGVCLLYTSPSPRD